ncbi:hypothetical protein FBG06_07830 [Campylobacter upsaliensis]|nr:hypothetical protein [Campylobacter upsaliensis]
MLTPFYHHAFISTLFGVFLESILLNSPVFIITKPKRSSNSSLLPNLFSNNFFKSSFLALSSL